MIRKKYRRILSGVMAAVLLCSSGMVQGAEPDKESVVMETEIPMPMSAEGEMIEAEAEEAAEDVAPEEPQPEEIVTEESGLEEMIPEELVTEEAVPEETVPEEMVPEESVPEEMVPEEAVPEEPVPEESVPEESVPEEPVPEESVLEDSVPEEPETEIAEPEINESRETESEKSAETESVPLTSLKMNVLDAAGNLLGMQQIAVPESLTCNGVTYPADYRNGVHRVQVPGDTKSIQIQVLEPVSLSEVHFTKWNGYLTEAEEKWYLCPDTTSGNDFSVSGNSYLVNLESYLLEDEFLSVEQYTVYGALNEECTYAEIFLYDQNVSAVLLVEILPTEMEEIQDITDEKETLDEEADLPEETGTEEEILSNAGASDKEIEKSFENTGANLAESAAVYVPKVSSINGDWQILGLARGEQDVDSKIYNQYLKNVVTTVTDKNGVLHKKKYTEYSRVVLALTALGKDVTNVGGHNLLEPLADFDQTVWQGVNGAIFALIAFDSHDYEIPKAPKGTTQTTRSNLISYILSQEIKGGGWALSGSTPDPDVTAMAIQALARYYNDDKLVKAAVDRGLAKLSSMQMSDGGYGSYGVVNSESCSQVIVALTAMGIDPNTDPRFVKNGKSVVDALLSFQTTGGAFKHEASGGADQMSTEQAYYALTSYQRYKNGQTSLYDMRDVVLESDRKKAAETEKLIDALPETITVQSKKKVQKALTAYNALTELQKTLLPSEKVEKLQKAVKTLEDLEVELDKEKPEKSDPKLEIEVDKNKDNDKNKPTSNKVASGTTKQVNLVSSSNRTGGTVAVKKDTKADSDKEEKKEEPVKKKTGSTQITPSAKKVILQMRSLFRKTPDTVKLPESVEDYSDAQVAAVMEVYLAYEALSTQEQKVVQQYANYNGYLEVLKKIREWNHYDSVSGTDLRENEEEILPWYVSLEVAPQLMGEEQQENVRTALKGKGEMLNLQDISLLNQKDGGEWQPEDLVRVRILMTDLGEYENVAIAHMKDDGSMNLIRAYISGDYLEFDTDEFSKFGIVGFHGTMEELMIEQEDHDIWLYYIPGIGAAVLLLILVVVRLSGSKRKKVMNDE